MDATWQVQQAKQRFSEVLRASEREGPQVITRHGEEVAVVLDIATYLQLAGVTVEFKDYLTRGPALDDLELVRDTRPAPIVAADGP